MISFSNRCFWTKAVAIWRGLDDAGHARLVELYLRHAGFEPVETHRLAEWVEDERDPLIAVVGRAPCFGKLSCNPDRRRALRRRLADAAGFASVEPSQILNI